MAGNTQAQASAASATAHATACSRGEPGWAVVMSNQALALSLPGLGGGPVPWDDGGMNRLANEQSPYLLQHASNPVDWWPWGEEAISEAKRRDVPILLSVGYASCHL